MKDADRLDRLIGIVVICLVIAVALFFGIRLWHKKGQEQMTASLDKSMAKGVAKAVEKAAEKDIEKNTLKTIKIPAAKPVIDFGKLGKDEKTDALMKQRKQDLGIDKGVDMIVKSDESFKVGDSVVSMQEILDKIRLIEGEIVEKDLDESGKLKIVQTDKGIIKELKAPGDRKTQDRVQAGGSIRHKINTSEQPAKKDMTGQSRWKTGQTVETGGVARHKIKPREQTAEKDTAGQSRQKTGQMIEPREDVRDKTETGKQTAEKDMTGQSRRKNRKNTDVFGIYVVQPDDNVWNIHFTFLKDYFDIRGTRLSPLSDEPESNGTSSGVGKLLKFSEKMVYIYNVRQHKIEVDLGLIHPLTKIVVFRMKQVFTLLDQIDYSRVNHIRYDGETLWLPAG